MILKANEKKWGRLRTKSNCKGFKEFIVEIHFKEGSGPGLIIGRMRIILKLDYIDFLRHPKVDGA